MISQDILSVVETRAEHDLEDRHRTVASEAARIKESMVARGTLYSSMTIHQLVDLVGNEYRVRTTLIWHALVRALSQAGVRVTESVAAELKNHLEGLLDAHSDDLPRIHNDASFSIRSAVRLE